MQAYAHISFFEHSTYSVPVPQTLNFFPMNYSASVSLIRFSIFKRDVTIFFPFFPFLFRFYALFVFSFHVLHQPSYFSTRFLVYQRPVFQIEQAMYPELDAYLERKIVIKFGKCSRWQETFGSSYLNTVYVK